MRLIPMETLLSRRKKKLKCLMMIEIALKIVLRFTSSIASKYLVKFYFSGFETLIFGYEFSGFF